MKQIICVLLLLLAVTIVPANSAIYTISESGTLTSFSSFPAALASSDSVKIVHVSSEYKISEDVIWPTTKSLVVEMGGAFSISPGKTLTIKGPFQAGPYKVFTGSGDVAGLLSTNVQWFGATGDGKVDDRIACQRAINATAVGGTLQIPKTASYYKINVSQLSEALTVATSMNIRLEGVLRATSHVNQKNPPYIMNITANDVTITGNGSFRGNGGHVLTENAQNNRPGLLRVSGHGTTIDGITFNDPQTYGIWLFSAAKTLITRCKFTGGPTIAQNAAAESYWAANPRTISPTKHNYIALTNACDYSSIVNNQFYMDTVTTGSSRTGIGADVTGGLAGKPMTHINVSENIFVDLHEHATYLTHINNSNVVNNTVRFTTLPSQQWGNAIKCSGKYNNIIGNNIYNAFKGGINAFSAVGNIISKNNLYNIGQTGIVVSNYTETINFGLDNNEISHNYLEGADTATELVYAGIQYMTVASPACTAKSFGGKIIGNTLVNWGRNAPNNYSYSVISVQGAGVGYEMYNFLIADNIITKGYSRGIYLSNVKNTKVSHNNIYNNLMPDFVGILSRTTSDLIFEGNTIEDRQAIPRLRTAFDFVATSNVLLINNEVFGAAASNPFGVNLSKNIKGSGNRILIND